MSDQSDQSDEELLESQIASRPPTTTSAAAKISALSDDESDDEVPAASTVRRERQATSPGPSYQSPPVSPGAGYEQRRRSPNRPLDSYNRTVSSGGNDSSAVDVDIVHLPPSVSLSCSLTTDLEEVPPASNPMLFRLRSDIAVANGESHADVLLRELKERDFDPLRFSEVLESNANLVTWSDGSRTLAIGNQQFHLVEDSIASRHFVFRKGDKVQTHHAGVSKVVRVQPTSTGDAGAKLVMAKAVERAANKGSSTKTILRCMDDDVEQKEKRARMERSRRERERLQAEARKRQMKERQSRPSRPLSVDVIESNDEDSADDHVKRIADGYEANQLLRAKRAPFPPSRTTADLSLKRRKAGGRRVLADDDDSESE